MQCEVMRDLAEVLFFNLRSYSLHYLCLFLYEIVFFFQIFEENYDFWKAYYIYIFNLLALNILWLSTLRTT